MFLRDFIDIGQRMNLLRSALTGANSSVLASEEAADWGWLEAAQRDLQRRSRAIFRDRRRWRSTWEKTKGNGSLMRRSLN